MRPLLLVLALVAAPASAQSSSTSPSAAAGAGTTTGATAPNGVQFGRAPAPLGSSVTLSESIDTAARLRSTRAQGGASLPALLRADGSAYRDSAATGDAADNALENAGRPAGTPLGATSGGATIPR